MIVQVNASYKPAFVYGGPTISVSKLSEMLVKAGEHVEVLTTTANGKKDFNYNGSDLIKIDGVPVRYFKRVTKDNSHFSPSLLTYFNKQINNYGIVHIHAWWNLVSMGVALICWKKKKSYVLSPRGTLGSYSFTNRSSFVKKSFHYIIGKRVLSRAIFQVSSKKEANDIKKLFPLSSPYVIPNFVDIVGSDKISTHKDEGLPFKLLFFSRVEEKKGLEFLIAALSSLNFPYILNVFGDGDPEYIKKIQIETPAHTNVFWKGALYGKGKFEVFANHDLLVLPSFDENFANVVIEALAVGTPTLLTSSVGLADYVEEKDLGWVCERSSVVIAGALNKIATSKNKLRRIRETAPKIIQQDYNEKHLIQQYVDFYSSIQVQFSN